jgi:outer membrane protein OmpA-like peptidoglycan-associated protein
MFKTTLYAHKNTSGLPFMKSSVYFFLFLQSFTRIFSQEPNFEAYIFEQNNRGFLNQVKVNVYATNNNTLLAELSTDATGRVVATLPVGIQVRVFSKKDVFLERNDTITVTNPKSFLKIELKRKPGYLFDATLAEVRDSANQTVDAIDGARLEIYNFTKKKMELTRERLDGPYFNFTFEQGNHYVILIRKEGYLAKRIDAHVNIDGCIICIEGVNNLRPGVQEVITSNMSMGTLLANIDMQRASVDSKINIANINWPYNSAEVTPAAGAELDKAITMLKTNPMYAFELGSHTDARGAEQYNFELSHKRAEAAVAYMIDKGIDPTRLKAVGYGETQLVNRCLNGINCTDQEHSINRRTELKITGIFSDAKEFEALPELLRKEALDKERAKLLVTQTQEFKVPELKVPEVKVPDVVAANTKALENATPEEKAPNTTQPTPAIPTRDTIQLIVPRSAPIAIDTTKSTRVSVPGPKAPNKPKAVVKPNTKPAKKN